MRDTLGLLGIVRNPQNSETRPYSSSNQRLDRRYGSGIEGRGRFIEQQHLWSHHQRADKREPQPLACRQAADRPSLRLLGKPQVFDKGACRRPFVEVVRRPYPPTSPAPPAYTRPSGAIRVRRSSSGRGRPGAPDLRWDQGLRWLAATMFCRPRTGRLWRCIHLPTTRARQL